ncbi:DUF6709 family protein [Paenibacillus sp. JJ-100]|uniref:DUF6709 family protein n=1 Tax=Paenibacillus sp. JJ-100 TaxID=2974896 RepID=UPI00232D271D|nr:DUF6709 family protein [Paenibacillus sp. JJ-100]
MATLLCGTMLVIGLINNKEDTEGFDNLKDLEPATISAGDHVEVEFERIHPAFAEFYMQREGDTTQMDKHYFYMYPYKGKGLVVKVPFYDSNRYDTLAQISNHGESVVSSPLVINGKIERMEPELIKYANEFMDEYVSPSDAKDPMGKEIWPYMVNLNIPSGLTEDHSELIYTIVGGIYVIILALISLVMVGRLLQLKHQQRKL